MTTKKSYFSMPILVFMLMAFNAYSQSMPPIWKFSDLNSILQSKNDTTYIINFWATWCKPCVGELPYFIQLEKKLKKTKTKLILVSLDGKKTLKTKLYKFIQDKKIESAIVLLDEPDYNEWIPKVDQTWEGSIPATIFKNNKKKIFVESEFDSVKSLEKILTTLNK